MASKTTGDFSIGDPMSDKPRVVVTGSFDILHTGHIHLLREAAKLGDVYVIVARDSTVIRIKKQPPILSEAQRLEIIQAIRYVTEASLGNESKNFLIKPIELKADIILLGPNQKVEEESIKNQLIAMGHPEIKVQRLTSLSEKYELNSSSAIKDKIKRTFTSNGN